MNKSPLVAFLLSFIPGLGHFYLGRPFRAFFYATGFFGPLFLIFIMLIMYNSGPRDDGFLVFLFLVAFLFATLNMIDMLVGLLKPTSPYRAGSVIGSSAPVNGIPIEGSPSLAATDASSSYKQQNERFFTILLSVIPGLAHFQLGLMQRGLTFLVGFFGLFTMITFVSLVTGAKGFFVFLFAMPVILFYGLFDAMQLLNRKQRGEEVPDRTIFEDFEHSRESGRKSKPLALLLSVFPGAGHLYLGLQQRGLQLMAGFLLSIYLMDALRLSLFLYLVPILWFYSLFDAMQMISKRDDEELKDVPVVKGLMNHQKGLGFALIAIGAYYLFNSVILGMIQEAFPNWPVAYWFQRYAQVTIVSVLFIAGGVKLMLGSKKKAPIEEAEIIR
jgi:TM2 domain-containing membrane protein YozV